MSMLAIIPARGGSKGVPRKNIIDINGKPLLAYTIEPALKAMTEGYIDHVIVSTDDDEIAKVAQEYHAEVPFVRPAELSSDSAKSVDLMMHAYNFFFERSIIFDEIVLLQPTSPLRTKNDIEEAVELFHRSKATSLISCYKEESINEYGLYHREGEWAVALNREHNKGIRRQDMPELYVRNGALFIVRADYMNRYKRVFDERPAIYVMPKERSINIDSMCDIEITRRYVCYEK